MSITCGNCKGKHDSVVDVKACYAGKQTMVKSDGTTAQVPGGLPAFATDPATDNQVYKAKAMLDERDTENIGRHLATAEWPVIETMMNVMDDKLVSKREISDLISALYNCPIKPTAAGTVPEGRYATQEGDEVRFWEVDKPQHGRWAGRTFFNQIVGSPGDWRQLKTNKATADKAAALILVDVVAAARLFGRKTKTCGKCASPLSHVCSRAAGYGKHCAEKIGWPYPSREEALAILQELGEDIDFMEMMVGAGDE